MELCDAEHNLVVSLGAFTGLIPRTETAIGIADGSMEIAILSRVGKPVSFLVDAVEREEGELRPILSRRKAQEMALSYLLDTLEPGMVIPASVTIWSPLAPLWTLAAVCPP